MAYNQEPPKEPSGREYKILRARLEGQDFVLVFCDYLSHLFDEDKLVFLHDFEDCVSKHQLVGTVVLLWSFDDGSIGFFPNSFSEIRNLVRHNTYQSIENRSNGSIFCTF